MELTYNSFDVVRMFEQNLSDYTSAPHVVVTNSCTNALILACLWHKVQKVTIPKKTYLSVPQSILHAGGTLEFVDKEWKGIYQLAPYPIYDSAKRFTSNMYQDGTTMCLSFHQKKILNIGKGGAILTDNEVEAEWYRRMRYEGRSQNIFYKEDNISLLGYNFYLDPERAARGLSILQHLPEHNEDQIEEGGYKDLTEFPLFQDVPVIKDLKC